MNAPPEQGNFSFEDPTGSRKEGEMPESCLAAVRHTEPTERSPLCEGNGGSSLLAMLGKLAAAGSTSTRWEPTEKEANFSHVKKKCLTFPFLPGENRRRPPLGHG